MLSYICVLFFLMGPALASHYANLFMDHALSGIFQSIVDSDLYPARLSEFKFDYKDKKAGVTVQAGFRGYAERFENVKRYSECDGPKNISGTPVINCTLVLTRVVTWHEGAIKYGVLPEVSYKAEGYIGPVYIKVGVSKLGKQRNPQVTSFSIIGHGPMNANVTILGPLNNQTIIVQEKYKSVIGVEILKVIQEKFQFAINLAVSALASQTANRFMDHVLSSVSFYYNDLDPARLSEFKFDYKDKKAGVTVQAWFRGYADGFKKVKRYSECDGPENISGTPVINCTLVLKRVETWHVGAIKYGVLHKATYEAKGYIGPVYIKVGVAQLVKERNPQITSFSIIEHGPMSANITILGPLNNQTIIVQEKYKSVVGAEVLKVIQNKFQFAINLAVRGERIPLL